MMPLSIMNVEKPSMDNLVHGFQTFGLACGLEIIALLTLPIGGCGDTPTWFGE